ncbi:MAG: DNA polymerase III subunit delta [Bacteroidales bacterium]|nr:DNA polymerase III subunit delta [Bacteroidales bacterium]
MIAFNKLIGELREGKYKTVYFLMGEEPYFIDVISDYIADHILSEEEKPFNLQIFYGRDVTMDTVIATARRFPVMSRNQVIVVKEAQQMITLEGLEHYLNSPAMSTILVFCYKHKKLDKRNKLTRLISEKCVLFESDRLQEEKIPVWTSSYLETKGYQIEPKAAWLLVDFVGSDLGRITNELDKLILLLPDDQKLVTSDLIEQNIGISKDYNNFELAKALTSKDILKANRIIGYFTKNSASNPATLTLSYLFYFFSKVLLYHGIVDKSRDHLAKEMGVHPYFIAEYRQASKIFSLTKTREIIALLREYDVKSKGAGSMAPDGELLRELVYRIIH